jgi:general L-amino acid transport system substrate-binding protein
MRPSQKPAALLALALLAPLLAACDVAVPGLTQPTPQPVIIVATPAVAATEAPLDPSPTAPPPTEAVAQAETPLPPEPAPATPEPAAPAPGETAPAPAGTRLLETVRARGRLICGTNADLPGFGFYDSVRQRWSGFDVDFCRAIAAAIFGDASAVEFVALDTSGPRERFNAVRSAQVDVLIRNTTWTLGRDIAGLAFGPTTFHDGQTFMVRADAGVSSINDLADARICVAAGTTSEQNLNDDFAARGIPFEIVVRDDENQLYPAYDAGDCDAVTSDSSQLASKKETLDDPSAHTILGDRISREPLGPVFIENDDQWRDVVSWAVFATMYAEELDVDQAKVERERESRDPRVRRLLGLEGELGQGLGLPADFGYQIISQVGSYADIYERNLGPNTPFNLDRGPNKVWNRGAGGVLASPPFR